MAERLPRPLGCAGRLLGVAAVLAGAGMVASHCSGGESSIVENPKLAAEAMSRLYDSCKLVEDEVKDEGKRYDDRSTVKFALALTMNPVARPFYEEWKDDNGSLRGDVDWDSGAIVTRFATKPDATKYHPDSVITIRGSYDDSNNGLRVASSDKDKPNEPGELWPRTYNYRPGGFIDVFKDTSTTFQVPVKGERKLGPDQSYLSAKYCGRLALKKTDKGLKWQQVPSSEPLEELEWKKVNGSYSYSGSRQKLYKGA